MVLTLYLSSLHLKVYLLVQLQSLVLYLFRFECCLLYPSDGILYIMLELHHHLLCLKDDAWRGAPVAVLNVILPWNLSVNYSTEDSCSPADIIYIHVIL